MVKDYIISIAVAIIAALGGSAGSLFGYRQFLIKRKDEKEEKGIQKRIDEAMEKVRSEIMKEVTTGLEERDRTGKKRFEINSRAIEENTEQINRLTKLVESQITKMDAFTESLTALNVIVKATAESQCNANYDRLLVVASKVLSTGKVTITEKTNLRQLYSSWKDLGGNDAKIDTMYEACEELDLILDD